jgi:hypothetical protein
MNKAAMTVALGGAKRPKLKKIVVNQNTSTPSTIRNGRGRDRTCCPTIN